MKENFLSNLEKSLEKIIEGAMSKFRGKVEPSEIAHGIWQEIVSHKNVGLQKVFVPNKFTIFLSSKDMENFKGIVSLVESEIKEYLLQEAKKRDFCFVGPLIFEWKEDTQKRAGTFEVISSFVECEETPVKENDRGKSKTLGFWGKLIVVEGFDKGKEFLLRPDKTVILGRGDNCDVVLGDPKVSLIHAKIFFEKDSFFIEDLGSKNGTFVNNKKITKSILKPNSVLKMGFSTLMFDLDDSTLVM